MKLDLSGQTVWVTGASRGIGRAIATELGRAGGKVACSYFGRKDGADSAVADIEQAGSQAIAVQVDVASNESCLEAHKQIEESLGPINILVNSAGIIDDNLFIALEDDSWHSVLNTNLLGVVHTTRCCVREMMRLRSGKIINISSVAATKGGRGQANYAASKGGVEAMSRSLAVELGKRNINVNCIAPGVIETEMTEEVIRLAKDEILSRQVIKRFGKPEEIAAWALFLASSHGDFVTGQTFCVDGGFKLV